MITLKVSLNSELIKVINYKVSLNSTLLPLRIFKDLLKEVTPLTL